MVKKLCRGDISFFIHAFGACFLICSGIVCLQIQNILSIFIFCSIIALNFLSIYFLYFFAFNYSVCIDKDKIIKKSGKKKWEYKWDDFIDCKFYMSPFLRFCGIIKLVAKDSSLSMTFEDNSYNILMEYCTSERVKTKIDKIWQEHSV